MQLSAQTPLLPDCATYSNTPHHPFLLGMGCHSSHPEPGHTSCTFCIVAHCQTVSGTPPTTLPAPRLPVIASWRRWRLPFSAGRRVGHLHREFLGHPLHLLPFQARGKNRRHLPIYLSM